MYIILDYIKEGVANMKIIDVIKFDGPQDALLWKYPYEDFNTASQLVVDETHEALLVVDGNAADLFKAGKRTLSVENIPFLRKLIEIPTNGVSPFPCKVFYINKVHQMDLLWGTQGPIPLEDPFYDVFMHVMANGSMSISIKDSRKFIIKLAGFRDEFDNDEIVKKFRGIISSQVKDCISKIMIKGFLSYFVITANLLEISEVVKDRLDAIFDEYGISIEYFNIETVEVPESDYQLVSQAKSKRASRMIEGYTWQEEREMIIAEKFASNQGTIGSIGGAMGGFMMGGVMGGSVVEIARDALSRSDAVEGVPPKDVQGTKSHVGLDKAPVEDVKAFFETEDNSSAVDAIKDKKDTPADDNACPNCGNKLEADARFCNECGTKIELEVIPEGKIKCPQCGKIVSKGKFCIECGFKFSNVCPKCGAELPENAKFCIECGNKL